MRQPAASPVPNAQRTDFAAGVLRDGELHPFTREEWKASGATWDEFMAQARTNAAADLATLKPEYTRNKRKVIEFATLRSPQPIVASAVLAPGFLRMFEETLGPKVIVAVPNRFVAFVFPALASSYQDYAPMIFQEYRDTAMPVSVEVFEVSAEGVRAIGIFEEP